MASVKKAKVAQKTTPIAVSGDVVLVVGPSGKKLRVHSLFIANASPVFNAMLGPNFAEGQQLKKSGLTEVVLPDDDAEAMELILKVIHGCNDTVPEKLTPDELVAVAVAADKYDCVGSLTFAMQIWLSCMSMTDPENLWAVAMTALVFRRQKAFAEATSALILNDAGSYLDGIRNYENLIDPVLLLKIAAKMEEERNKLRMALVMDIIGGEWQCDQHCKAKNRVSWFKGVIQRTGGFGQSAISSTLHTLTDEASRNDARAGSYYYSASTSKSDLSDFFKSVSEKVNLRHERESGLCLRCIQTGESHQWHASQ
ncbi:hypothetical protein SEPCBS119000_006459 [Sporothrix epigloea]|uniref:BTB domain-containing protein n=1 Tax=Sporothrix epigloea TaxID=1892477 RepID=A0ABP0E338_9PEZI